MVWFANVRHIYRLLYSFLLIDDWISLSQRFEKDARRIFILYMYKLMQGIFKWHAYLLHVIFTFM